MNRYFFDIADRNGFHGDDFGDEFDSFDEARDQAQSLLADIVRAELPSGELSIISCNVRNDTDRIVYRGKLTFEGTRDPV